MKMLKEMAEVGDLGLGKFADKAKTLVSAVLTATVGFFMSRTVLVGGMAPLGAALAAGLPIKQALPAAAGALIGYLLPGSGVSALKYTAVLLAVTVIRLFLNGIKGIGRSAVWSAITAAVTVMCVGFASLGSELYSDGAVAVAEGAVAGLGAYFFRRSQDIKNLRAGLSTEQTACLLASASLLLAAFYNTELDGISFGRIVGALLIICAARFGRVGAGAVCGTAVAATVCLVGGDTPSAVFYCVAGLLCGVFSPFGRVAEAATPILLATVWALFCKGERSSLIMLAEVSAAGVISLMLPRTLTSAVAKVMSPQTVTPDSKGLRRTLTMRLGFASSALRGVSETVEDVARCLEITSKPSFSAVLQEVENDACKGCSFHSYCWERERKITVDALIGMSGAVRKCRPIELAEVPEEFTERCLRLEKVEAALSTRYSKFLSEISAGKRVGEMRGIVSDQMEGIADMLEELSDEFRTAQNYDIILAGRVAAALKEVDINADECSCVVDRFGRLTVEIRLLHTPELPINRAKVLSVLEEICERDFEPPEINRSGHSYYITATEKALLSVDCACTQLIQGTNRHCGDTCRYFFDGRGRLVVIVSDGMGSGGRAAVDSAMTAGLAERLIKAGFGYDCTLRLVNSAMLFKSTDESLATLDISCIDLYNGRTEMFKAGAAPTLVRRSGRTGRAECKSLPAGILNEIGFDKATVTLKEDDILLMMSDGACTDGTDWICAELEAFGNGGAKQLADRIASSARRRRHDGHDDDITVFAAVVERAV